MNEKLLELAKELATRNYKLSVFEDRLSNGQTIYMAKNPELKGCMAQGKTIDEAIKNLKDARIDYIYDSLEDNIPVPSPAALATQTAFTIDAEQITISQTISAEKNLQDITQQGHSKQLYEVWIGS